MLMTEKPLIEMSYGWRCDGHCQQRADGMWKDRERAVVCVERMNQPVGQPHRYVLTETVVRDAL